MKNEWSQKTGSARTRQLAIAGQQQCYTCMEGIVPSPVPGSCSSAWEAAVDESRFLQQGGEIHVHVKFHDLDSEPGLSKSESQVQQAHESRRVPCIRNRFLCCPTFVWCSDSTVDMKMEATFAKSKYRLFQQAFTLVSFMMPVWVLFLAVCCHEEPPGTCDNVGWCR